jgi:hypothetical protein
MKNRVVSISLAVMLALSVGLIACTEAPDTTPPVESDEATDIVIEQVVQPFWAQADQTRGLRANRHIELLREDTTVQPAFSAVDGGPPQITCENDCWLFMIDEAPRAHFCHGVQIVLVDAWTGEVDIIESEWWPELNGQPIFDTIEMREDAGTIIWYEPPSFDLEPLGEFTWPDLPWSGQGCEAWAVIVCGYDDLPDTLLLRRTQMGTGEYRLVRHSNMLAIMMLLESGVGTYLRWSTVDLTPPKYTTIALLRNSRGYHLRGRPG